MPSAMTGAQRSLPSFFNYPDKMQQISHRTAKDTGTAAEIPRPGSTAADHGQGLRDPLTLSVLRSPGLSLPPASCIITWMKRLRGTRCSPAPSYRTVIYLIRQVLWAQLYQRESRV